MICEAGTLSSFDRNLISALFAFPSIGGACSLIFTASSSIPTTLLVEARGIRRTFMIAPSAVSVIMLMMFYCSFLKLYSREDFPSYFVIMLMIDFVRH